MGRKTRQIGLKMRKEGVGWFAVECVVEIMAHVVSIEQLLRCWRVGLFGKFDGSPRLCGG